MSLPTTPVSKLSPRTPNAQSGTDSKHKMKKDSQERKRLHRATKKTIDYNESRKYVKRLCDKTVEGGISTLVQGGCNVQDN